ncbi:hypothetical protein K474DRAFT_468989 [Panus rudis PR-1116 ss-1]|nr:hypothetical protein K474DRAFT_468989 [Panus rudis PR-1116 ss-1]
MCMSTPAIFSGARVVSVVSKHEMYRRFLKFFLNRWIPISRARLITRLASAHRISPFFAVALCLSPTWMPWNAFPHTRTYDFTMWKIRTSDLAEGGIGPVSPIVQVVPRGIHSCARVQFHLKVEASMVLSNRWLDDHCASAERRADLEKLEKVV